MKNKKTISKKTIKSNAKSKKVVSKKAIKPKKNALRKIERDLQWVGHQRLMQKPKSQEDVQQRELMLSVAKVYNIPLPGITILANQPYINKDGLLYKAHEYFRITNIRTEFIQTALKPDETAIVKATISTKEGIEVEGIGEASRANIKLDLVKNTLNMMAETRATNRAIRKLIAMKLWEDVEKRLAKERIDETKKAKIIEVGKSSYEEMDNEGTNLPTDENSIKEMVKVAVDKCDDLDKLFDLMENIRKSDMYSEATKREILRIIDEKANLLADLKALKE